MPFFRCMAGILIVKPIRRTLLFATLAVAVWLLHAPLLQFLAQLLIADQPDGDYQLVCIASRNGWPADDWCYDAAAERFLAKSSCNILLVQPPDNRLIELGIAPTFEAISRRELELRGVPQTSISVVRSKICGERAAIEAIRPRLSQQPNNSAVLLCNLFYSARIRLLVDRVLDPNQATRVRVRGVPSQQCDATNWWKSRDGYKVFGDAWLRQLFHWCGGSDEAASSYSADDYQRKVLQSFSEDTP